MTLRYMTGETRAEEDRRNCCRCDHYRGYVCAEHREPSYAQLQKLLVDLTLIIDNEQKARVAATIEGSELEQQLAALLREAAAAKACTVLLTPGWYKRAKEVVG